MNLHELTKSRTSPLLWGVNLSSAEFGSTLPGVYGTDYSWPGNDDVDAMAGNGVTIIRLPFRWERVQRTLGGALDATEMGYMTAAVARITGYGIVCVLDPHNFARYNSNIIGAGVVTTAHFADLWARLAAVFKTNPLVRFGLINEPFGISSTIWRDSAQAAIDAIRTEGATNRIYVGGTDYSNGHRFIQSGWSEQYLAITDTLNNTAAEIHQYMDSDSSGSTSGVVSASIAVDRIKAVTDWCRSNGIRAFLGEVNVGDQSSALGSTAHQALFNLFSHLRMNSDVWEAVTLWSTGPRWPSDYFFNLNNRSGAIDMRLNMAGKVLG